MIQEAYCSYEVSKLLKEKGFKESTQLVWYEHLPSQNAGHSSEIGKPKRDYFYWEKDGERNSLWTNNSLVPSYISGEVYSCPTIQMAMKWLREKYHIHADPIKQGNYNDCSEYYTWIVARMGIIYRNSGVAEKLSYEEACEAALKYALETLIENESK